MASAKEANELTTHFVKVYRLRYGVPPIINREKARWSWENMLIDLSFKEVKELIEYYLDSVSQDGHSFSGFIYNYHKILEVQRAQTEDAENRKKLMQSSKTKVEEWREKRDRRSSQR